MQENRQDTDSLPMQSERSSLDQNHTLQVNKRVFKMIIILIVITIILLIGLTMFSFETLQKISKKTQSYLESYLPIHAGEMEYGRVPEEYWQHRLQMIKAMGLNAVSSYVIWNHHQVRKGQFDFTTGNKNLKKYLQLTQKVGLNVLLRPGPYICAQWDFGGLPSRLLGISDLIIRSANKLYEDEVKIFFRAVAPIIKPFLASKGGNIILIQIQNEYGYIGSDNQHILNLAQMWKDLQIDSQFYLEDPGHVWGTSYWPKAHIGMSQTAASLLRYVDIEVSPKRSNRSIIFSGQIYSGWFTQWGWDWGTVSTQDLIKSIKALLQHNRSFSLYVTHGGTNFGVTAGANGYNGFYEYLPHITSYDYDAPINQIGRPTQKYHQIRKLFKHHYKEQITIPEIPQPLPSISIKQFIPDPFANLWQNLPEPTVINSDLTYFESSQLQMYEQGIVIYQTALPEARTYYFDASIRDFGLIYVDDDLVAQIVRRKAKVEPFEVQCQQQEGCQLKILVQAMGHKNFGTDQREDKKGITHFQEIGNGNTYKWNIYTIPVLTPQFEEWNNGTTQISYPAIFRAQVSLQTIGDTYFDMKNYKKGYLYVNGHLLGRYWELGPQERLFCPGVWLKQGVNEVLVFELLESGLQGVKGVGVLREDV